MTVELVLWIGTAGLAALGAGFGAASYFLLRRGENKETAEAGTEERDWGEQEDREITEGIRNLLAYQVERRKGEG